MPKKIVTIGELLWDILPDQMVLGGAPANFSYRINNLGFASYLVTRLGRDDLGKKAFKILKKQGVNTQFIQWDDHHPTGTVNVFFDRDHNPDYEIIKHVAYDFIAYSPALEDLSAAADCIYFGTLVQRSPVTRSTIDRVLHANPDCLKFCDINLRKECYSEDTVRSALSQADILKLNENETYDLKEILNLHAENLEEIGRELVEEYSLECCITTLEERGALACDKNGEVIYSPGFKTQLVDSLGAGDAFSAAFIEQYLSGGDLRKACEYGNILGAIVTTQKGATQPISDLDIQQFSFNKYDKCFDHRIKN